MEMVMANPSSYLAAPPSPPSFGDPLPHCRYYYAASAPTTPSRAAAIYADFYGWDQEKPPMGPMPEDAEASSEFAFCFHEGEWPMPPLATADDLFEEGMIRPLIPPPSTSAKKDGEGMTASSRGGRGGGGGRGEGRSSKSTVMTAKEALRDRGRSAVSSTGEASSRGRRASRSLSPLRGGGGGEEEDFPKLSSCSSSMLKSGGGSKKWKLKDLFLFRSASEGRATGRGSRDPLRRYTLLPSLASSSSLFNNKPINESCGAANPPSAHEMYYSAHRAASEELKRKTPLPYERHGLFACLRFNPALHSVKKGFFYSRKQSNSQLN